MAVAAAVWLGEAGGEQVVMVESDAELFCCRCLKRKESLRAGGVGGAWADSETELCCGECLGIWERDM